MANPTAYAAFDAAKAVKADTETVCGVITKDGDPAYFLMPASALEDEIQNAAFQIREGRPMGDGERTFIAAFKRHQQRA